MNLEVLLNDRMVGRLTEARNGDGVDFVPDEAWAADEARPVLGQQFEDNPTRIHRTHGPVLPAWFSNLLPEGILWDLLLDDRDAGGNQELKLIARLGLDLPGAVVVRPASEGSVGATEQDGPSPSDGDDGSNYAATQMKFSLAGVQLKFSAVQRQRRFNLAAADETGDWIVKTPDVRYPDVPRHEYATMLWATVAGFDVPEIQLVNRDQIGNLPARWEFPRAEPAFAIKRFDRRPGGRVHMEDFAQVVGVRRDQKYGAASYEQMARIIGAVAGNDGVYEFVRRLALVVATANGDAHLKNWTLLYTQPRAARLSPLYDQVTTMAFITEDKLALNLARSKNWEDVGEQSFRRLATKVGLDPHRVWEQTDQTLERVTHAWDQVSGEFPAATRALLAQHWDRVPLLKGRWRAR